MFFKALGVHWHPYEGGPHLGPPLLTALRSIVLGGERSVTVVLVRVLTTATFCWFPVTVVLEARVERRRAVCPAGSGL